MVKLPGNAPHPIRNSRRKNVRPASFESVVSDRVFPECVISSRVFSMSQKKPSKKEKEKEKAAAAAAAAAAAKATPRLSEFKHNEVYLFKSESLGSGSYGMVCKAMCDELPCAAKLMHTVFFQFPSNHDMLQRFEQECQVLSSIRHPCIVQYLGTHIDPETNLPVLLMELMDESLTKFLERSPEPLPYHLQVSFCHDIALALAYLHSNGIIHRDLSSNNVLLIAGKRAKVTDFGMAKLIEVNPRMTPLTQCPGTLCYMAPETLRARPEYTAKLDVFSLGVLIIQIITRKFPNPTDSKKMVDDARLGTVEVPIPERERRQDDFREVDPSHPLLQPALECIEDRDIDRPVAFQLCRHLMTLKRTPQFEESVQQALERSASLLKVEDDLKEKKEGMRILQEAVEKQARSLRHLEQEKEERVSMKEQEIVALKQELEAARQEMENFSLHSSDSFSLRSEVFTSLPMLDGAAAGEDSEAMESSLNLEAPSPARWFHGRITRLQACQRLEEVGIPGAYLLRESEASHGVFVLSFLDRERRVHHFRIVSERGRVNIGGNMWFSSLQNLVGYYTRYSSVVEKYPERLECPVSPRQPSPSPVPVPVPEQKEI